MMVSAHRVRYAAAVPHTLAWNFSGWRRSSLATSATSGWTSTVPECGLKRCGVRTIALAVFLKSSKRGAPSPDSYRGPARCTKHEGSMPRGIGWPAGPKCPSCVSLPSG